MVIHMPVGLTAAMEEQMIKVMIFETMKLSKQGWEVWGLISGWVRVLRDLTLSLLI